MVNHTVCRRQCFNQLIAGQTPPGTDRSRFTREVTGVHSARPPALFPTSLSSFPLLQASSLRPLIPHNKDQNWNRLSGHTYPSRFVDFLHSAVPTFSILVLLALVEIPSNPSAPFAIGECIKLLSLLFSCHRLVPLWPSGSCHLRSVTTMAWNSPGPFYPPFPLVACLFLFHASLGLSSRSFSRSSLFGALLIILVHLPSPPDLNTPVSDLFWLLRLLP